MKCTIAGCPGEYESRLVIQTLRPNGHTMVIEDVPADVCNVCGDTLFSPETVQSLEQVLATPPQATHTIPAITFPLGAIPDETVSS